jgi:hypothetical protein
MVTRRALFTSLLASLPASLLVFACSSAYADQPVAGPSLPPAHIALGIAPPRTRAPYEVQILRDDGSVLPTYALRGRYYVQGSADERYVIRVTNPTPRRIEAVVSVDGLDAIDGENGDLAKRGYVVPPYGETRIEGFRTSEADVATFRFSSVSGSYAGQKGKARNVGVIAVALFEERAAPEIVLPPPPPRYRPYDEDRNDPYGAGEVHREREQAGRGAEAAPARPAPQVSAAPSAPSPVPPPYKDSSAKAAPRSEAAPSGGRYSPPADIDDDIVAPEPAPPSRAQRERLGLGTEFGEQRYSAVSYTQFVRASTRPAAIAELRYNDADGLVALGIPVRPLPGRREVMLRETADPFPGDHFARPPR